MIADAILRGAQETLLNNSVYFLKKAFKKPNEV